MANPQKFYLSHMSDKTGYRATWDPGRPLKIGFIGKLDSSGALVIYSSLEKEGIPVEVLSDDSKIDMDYTSSDSITISTKLSGSAPIAGSVLSEGEAGFNFEFKSDKGVVFQSTGNTTTQLINLAEIKNKILDKYKNGNWDKDWVVVTELVTAETATIIISNSSNVNLDLKANANIGTQDIKITDASFGFTVARERGSTLKYITQSGLTPLYKIMGIWRPILGSVDVRPKDVEAGTVLAEKQDEFKLLAFDPAELGKE